MAFFFAAAGTRVQSAGATTLTPTLTTSAAAPSRLKFAVCQVKSNDVISTATAGWTKLDQQNSGVSFTAAIFIGTATAADPVFTWATSVASAAQQWYYTNGSDIVETAIVGFLGSTVGSTATHTSASQTSTRFSSMGVYIDVAASNGSLTTPTGWTKGFDNGSVTDSGVTSTGYKQLTAVGSTTGAISTAGVTAAWVQWQVELLITTAAAGLSDSETQVVPWVDPGPGLGIAETQIVPWLSSGPGLGIGETQVVLWLEIPPDVTVTPTGVQAAGLIGTITTGVQAAGLIGSVTVGLGPDAAVSGVSALGLIGTVTVTTSSPATNVPVTSVSGLGLIGGVSFTSSVMVNLIGVAAAGRTGFINAWQPVDDSTPSQCPWVLVDDSTPSQCTWTLVDDSTPNQTTWTDIAS